MTPTFRPYGVADELRARGPLSPDLTRSTTFAKENAEELRAVGAYERPGEFYPRQGNPNLRRFESRVASLEGTEGAVSFASGMAALHAIGFGLLGAGDAVAAGRDLYGGMSALLREDLPRFGVDVRAFDPFDERDVARAVAPPVKLVHVETPTNPLCRVVPLARVVEAARRAGSLVSVDATFLPPPLQRPIALGVDLVMHSATKYLGGHSDTLGGIVSGRLELLDRIEAFRRRTGAMLSPDTAWLLTRSLHTLEMRVRAQSATAARLAAFLESIRAEGGPVARVHYPGLPGHPDHETAKRQMAVFGGIVAFEVKGGLDGATRVYDRFRTIYRAVSLGGVETIASIPLHTSHAKATADERERSGIRDGLIRLSVGLDPVEAIEADLAQALDA